MLFNQNIDSWFLFIMILTIVTMFYGLKSLLKIINISDFLYTPSLMEYDDEPAHVKICAGVIYRNAYLVLLMVFLLTVSLAYSVTMSDPVVIEKEVMKECQSNP